jgi:two-component system cell cycle sensor histidine kinase/response regulator CckA
MKRKDELGPFFDLSPDLLCVADLNGRFTILNSAWEKTLGFSITELFSRPYIDFVHPDDRASTLTEIARLIRRPTSVSFTNRYCCKDGSYKWLRWDCSSELNDAHIYAIVRDITEMKRLQKANQLLNSLVAASPQAIIAVDKRFNVRLWNPAAGRIFGWTADEVLGSRVPFVSEDKIQESNWFSQRALQGASFANHELRRTRRDGRTVDLLVSTATTYDEKGSRDGFVSIAADITEYKTLEQQLLRAQRMGTLGTLAGGIAHDLNNVLAPIAMSLDLFRPKLLDADSRRTLDTLDNCVRHGADLIRQILTFARGLDGERVPVQAEHLIRQTAEVLLQTLPKSINVVSRVATDLWPVFADATQLHQVLMNLCINARDAMPDGGELTISVRNVEMDLKTHERSECKPDAKRKRDSAQPQDRAQPSSNVERSPGPHILLEVRDTGQGIPPEIRSKIFEPFFTTKGLGKGTGLGLSMVSAIVRNHGGFIDVDSEAGRGTSFKVYFPAIFDKGESVPQDFEPLDMGAGELILVVDDEAAVREIARVTLESYGYRVLEAAEGAEALATYSLHRDEIRVVISDMDMPVMNGAAMVSLLEQINPNVRVISASGMVSPGKPAFATVPKPFRVILPKPFTAAELLRTVRDILDVA